MIAALGWIGARGPWALAAGLALCFLMPEVSAALRPALPFLVPVVLGLAMARVDLGATARAALVPRTAAALAGLSLLLLPVSGAVHAGLAAAAGLDADLFRALVYLAAAPPIASAANLCFLLGYDARRALQVTVVATLATPILGPVTVALFLAEAAPLGPAELGLKLGLMIAGGAAVGLGLRRALGAERIAAHSRAFDGLGVLALVIFVIPIFDGVPGMILEAPGRAAAVLAVACIANLGAHLVLRLGAARFRPAAEAGTYGVLFGNRTIALYLAALPPDPQFTLFVALYQVPMLLTPLVVRSFGRPREIDLGEGRH